jgi:hypothetical protein
LLFQGSSDRKKINTLTYRCGIARSNGRRESPKRKVRRRAVNPQKMITSQRMSFIWSAIS